MTYPPPAKPRPDFVVMEYCEECGGFAVELPRLKGYDWHWSCLMPEMCYPPPCYGEVQRVCYRLDRIKLDHILEDHVPPTTSPGTRESEHDGTRASR